jgi:hypothetical protein
LHRHDAKAAKDTILFGSGPEDLMAQFWGVQKFRLFLSIRPSAMAFLAPWRLGVSDWG